MRNSFYIQFCFAFFCAIFVGQGACTSKLNSFQKKQTFYEGTSSISEPNYKENRKEDRFSRDIIEPRLFTHLIQKLLTRTENWKKNMKKVANNLVSTYFHPENASGSSIFHKKEINPELPKLGKKERKRSVNKSNTSEQEAKKPFNFSPVVQFVPASLDLSNKILFYQPQVIFNGSVYIEPNKDMNSKQTLEWLKTRDRSNMFYV